MWWIARLCEEFGCLPSQAVREWQTAPDGLLEEIVEMRAYVKAKVAYEQAQQMDEGPARQRVMRDPLVQLVQEHDFAPILARVRASDDDGR